jgi:uncharacterized membrane protein YfcA
LLVGLAMGLLGGGGTVLLLPLLVYAGGMETKEAIATSLVVVGLSAASATVQHAREGRVEWKIGLGFAGAAMLGAFPGGWSAQFVSGRTLMLGFASMMAIAGVAMLWGHAETEKSEVSVQPRWSFILLGGLLVGLLTGPIGAGGGFLMVPALVLLGGLEMHKAVGTSLMVMACKSVAALGGHITHVSLDLQTVAAIALAAMLGSAMGARAAGWISPARLRTAFGVLVLVLALQTTWSELGGETELVGAGTQSEYFTEQP